ncbi:monosaccharide ABC transporter substrate-binding protein (CUT2 family) [Microcella putealis]|uniref:Monosaccharide ABC transporter substrate-binding protein (CUT2 family) n=1 Tax=Microcella putealis TaxID=337005 RepID=A0A4Q7LRB6_9MICO|nr:sugar ABC transporter substrate-binding protein [Microcella putealis]RZS57304.1 monosaccharide ABC transporter substrate-binding protein (CUT2 family) [Microcella putealis]TQM19553.1 monosaccharide ABC transporter substrate-binding protein (CUT2 family) [Microcella putealis]
MRRSPLARKSRLSLIALAAATALTLGACAADAGEAPAPSDDDSAAPAPTEETLQVAFISFAVANTYDEPMLAEIERVAAENNIEITVFDGNLDPNLQVTLVQDVIASGQYDGLITQPVFGPALVDITRQAIDAGLTVVNVDQILGDDFTTGATQVEGLAANVVFVPSEIGTKFGEQAVEACASQDLDPCNVAFLHDVKASAIGVALYDAFNAVVEGTPVQIVAEGETFYNPAAAQTAVADILTANADIDLIATSDQGLQGAVQAIEAAGRGLDEFLMIGYGGSAWGKERVSEGVVYSNVVQAPATEGRLAMEAMVDALRNGNNQGDIDPFADFPNNGVMTRDTADQFTGEWVG